MRRAAVFDPTSVYRYALTREWDPSLPRVCFVMLNPSVADADRDDPTVRRCLGFARAWDFGTLEVVNLFAFRATRPADLRRAADPVGPENDAHVARAVRMAALTVAAWGAHGAHLGRGAAVARLLPPDARCFGRTLSGEPVHPLYQRGDARTIPLSDGPRPEGDPEPCARF